MTPSPGRNPVDASVRALRGMLHGYVASQGVFVVAKLGIADHLVAGPVECRELARRTGSHPGSLYRLMRAMASVGLFAEDEAQRFQLTEMGTVLRSDLPGSIRWECLLFGAEPYRACAELLHSVSTGETGFSQVFGMEHLDYLALHPEASETFNRAMTQMTTFVARDVVANYDLSGVQTLVDVGGGHGVMLATLLKENPHMRGILYELPHAAEGAEAFLAQEGVADRVELATGDALAAVPAGGDAYLLKSVLHLLQNEDAGRLLRNCRGAITGDGKLLVVERVIPHDNEPFWGKFVDLVMLTVTGGRERTESEYDVLLEGAGFQRRNTTPLPSGFSIIEAG